MPTASQLRLLPAPQPLVERLGAAFFRGIPSAPGVYRMYDGEGGLVYVGKAKDLRARLASYRRTHGQSRKTIRLIHVARRIEWELCVDEAAARRRESEWIRTTRPRFNRAGTWPRSARFVRVTSETDGFRIAVVAEPEGDGDVFGAFRGGVALAVAALGRLLWFAWEGRSEPRELPHALVASEGVRDFVAGHRSAPAWRDAVLAYFGGEDDGLLGRLVKEVPEPAAGFDRAFVARQFEVLQDFHRRGPLRNRRLRALLPGDRRLLAPEEHADWQAWLGPEAIPADWRLEVVEPPGRSSFVFSEEANPPKGPDAAHAPAAAADS